MKPEEILKIFWEYLENLSRGALKLNPALEERFIFHWLITPQLIRSMGLIWPIEIDSISQE